MRLNLATLFLSGVGLVVTAPSGLQERQAIDDSCSLTHFEFNCPEDITVGQPFQVRFCSGEYDKTSTNKMWFVWGFGDAGSGIDQKIPVVEMTPNIGSGYLFNTTIDYSTSSVDGNYTVGILEYINDYYVPHSFKWYPKIAHIHN